MRPLEAALLIALLFALFTSLLQRNRTKRWVRFTAYCPAALVLAQLVIEHQRWQLWPMYATAVVLLLLQLVRDLRHSDQSRPLPTWERVCGIAVIIAGIVVSVISGALAYALPVFKLPAPTGTYPIATTRLHFIDYSREDTHSANSADYREIPVRVWYPAAENEKGRFPYLEPAEAEALSVSYHLPAFFLSHLSLVSTHSANATSAAPGRFPLILYSPSGYVAQATALCEELASNGFVVASVNHVYWNAYTHDSVGTVHINDAENAYYRQMWKEELSEETVHVKDLITRCESLDEKYRLHQRLNNAMPTEVTDIREWAEDLSFVISQIRRVRGAPAGLSSAIDLNRVGVLGFSKGGAAAGQVAISDPRVRAGINLDGFMFGEVVTQPIPCSFMFVHSEPFLPDAYINDLFFEQSMGFAALTKIRGAQHANFSDLSLFGPLITSGEQFGQIDGMRLTVLLNRMVSSFFDSQLKDTSSLKALISLGEEPEIELQYKLAPAAATIGDH